MRLKSIFTISSIFLSLSILQGCDQRPVEKSEKPFSLGGITIGNSKSEIDKLHKFLPCKTETKGTAECYLDDREKRYDFHGASVLYAKIKLLELYEYISEIEFSTKGKTISKYEIESSWGIKGRCLTKFDIDDAAKFDSDSTAPFIRYLNEITLIPSGYSDFICVLPTSQVFQYKKYDGQDGGASLFYLKEIWVRNFEYIFRAKNSIAGAKEEIDQKLNNRTPSHQVKPNPAACKNYEYGTDSYHENISKLAKLIGRPEGDYDRLMESYIGYLCSGKFTEAQGMVNDGSVDREEAASIRRILSQ